MLGLILEKGGLKILVCKVGCERVSRVLNLL